MWGQYYFNNHFRMGSPKFHYELCHYAEVEKNLAVVAPRGSAKSTVLTFLKCIHSICFKKKHFIVIVQNTFSKAAGTLETIKGEIKTNNMLRRDFPLVIKKDAEGDSIFRYPGPGWEVRVLCKGADQIGSIRGEKFGAHRPDLIIVDDLEDDKSVKNPELRQELERTFVDVLKYAGDETTQTIAVGTVLHDDCLIAKMVDADRFKMFKKMRYQARYELNGVQKSLWPEKWTIEKLKEMEVEDPEGFAKEMQGDPSSGIYEDFKREDFRYWRELDNTVVLLDTEGNSVARYPLRDCKAAIACDLAWDEKRTSDDSVILPGYLTPGNDILIGEYIAKKGMRPDELEEALFTMERTLASKTGNPVAIGFEKAKLEKVMKWLLGQAMRRRNKFLWIKDLKWDGDKITRIVTRLSTRYKNHTVYHRRGMGDLENQLLRIRSTAHDDIADCAQGLAQLLDYPKVVKKQATQDDSFEKLRKFAMDARKKDRHAFVFGAKGKRSFLPSRLCPV